MRTQSLAQEATMLDKLQRALSDVRNHRDENKIRSQLIRDMETEREAMDKARQELARRSQTLESDLERAGQDYRDLVAHKERLEKEKSETLRQLKDANRREKRHLQLIQDLEQEIRHNVKPYSITNVARAGRSATSIVASANGVATIGMSDQAHSQLECTESSPDFSQPLIVDNISMNLSDSSGVSLEDSGGKQKISTSWSSPSGLEQKPKVWASMTDTPEAGSVVQRASPESAVRMGNVLTEHLSFLDLSSADNRDNLEKNCAAFADFLAELDGVGCDSPSTHPCSSHATDAIEEARCSREIHNTLTIGSRCGSTELSSLANSPY